MEMWNSDWITNNDVKNASGMDIFMDAVDTLFDAKDNKKTLEQMTLEEILEQNAKGQGKHVLLVEDNELNAKIVQLMLTDAGAEVTLVSDGKQAVDLFAQKPQGTFDAILTDVMMPVMDGLTEARTIRALKRPDAKTIPVIAMTANASREDEEKCLEAGMNAHIAKPLDVQRVKKVITECVMKP